MRGEFKNISFALSENGRIIFINSGWELSSRAKDKSIEKDSSSFYLFFDQITTVQQSIFKY